MDPKTKWLLIEVLAPLFGASLLCILWGLATKLTTNDSEEKYHWDSSIDSMGWLYGCSMIGIQNAVRISENYQTNLLFIAIGCIASMLILISSLNNKGKDPNWKPPKRMHFASVVLLVVVIYNSYVTKVFS